MDYLKGKRLLIMGGIQKACEIVEKARELGIYVMVTDYIEDSPAKKIADESFMVSTTDVDAVVDLCKEKKVDGVFTSFIDSMLPYCYEVCKRLGFPFYATKKHLDICTNKQEFKKLCIENNVEVAKGVYCDNNFTGDDIDNIDKIGYPVIVKPVDNSGGTGVTICYNKEEVINGCNKALSFSKNKKIIIEQFIEGEEVVATYIMRDGEIYLMCLFDKYMNNEQKGLPSLPEAFIYPSIYTEMYVKQYNSKFISMLKNAGFKNGTLFIETIVNQNGIFFIEPGYRLNGASDHRYISKLNKLNGLEMLLCYSLTGNMGCGDLSLLNPELDKYCCTLTMCAKEGVLSKIEGLDKIQTNDNIIGYETFHNIGDYIERSGTSRQRVLRFYLMSNSVKHICKIIHEIQDNIKVYDQNHNDLLLNKFDTTRITERYTR